MRRTRHEVLDFASCIPWRFAPGKPSLPANSNSRSSELPPVITAWMNFKVFWLKKVLTITKCKQQIQLCCFVAFHPPKSRNCYKCSSLLYKFVAQLCCTVFSQIFVAQSHCIELRLCNLVVQDLWRILVEDRRFITLLHYLVVQLWCDILQSCFLIYF